MIKKFYGFSLVVALITFLLNVTKGVTLFTSFVRSALVYLGILFTFFIAGHLLKWAMSGNIKEPGTEMVASDEEEQPEGETEK